MIEKDRFKPTLYVYKILMRILAKAGYTHMVFELFKRLTGSHDDDWKNNNTKNQKQLHQIITLMFLACSKSTWPEYAIRKTDAIRSYLKNRQIIPNEKNYSAMISAYGKAGAIYESFNVVDEMILNGIKPNLSTFNNLLCACISQPNYGFKYALMTWSMCLKYKIKPDIRMYNLMLKAATDCNIDKDNKKLLFNREVQNHKQLINENKNLFPIKSKEANEFLDQVHQDLDSLPKTDEINNLKTEKENLKIIALNEKLQDKSTVESLYPEVTHINSKSNAEIIKLKPDDVHIIEELKVVGKSLEKQLRDLEWWQDIKSNLDRAELVKSLAEFNPELKKHILTTSYESVLTKVDLNVEKDLLAHFVPEQDTGKDRFELIGGLSIFDAMKYHKVKPDIKTFNMIIQVLIS
jgi:pentatricopeptide repeat protein